MIRVAYPVRKLRRRDCAILPLVLKKKWYDMIASGEKLEEYREFKPFWQKRIEKWKSNQSGSWQEMSSNKWLVIGFSCGYRKPDMFFLLHFNTVLEGAQHPEWGEPEGVHYVLGFRERVEFEEDNGDAR